MAEEGGSDRGEINGGFGSVDSVESRWVFQDEDESQTEEDDGDARYLTTLDSEDEENGEQRLIRTGPRIDSFDVEALEVPGAQRNDYEDFSGIRRIVLAFQTLGVVFVKYVLVVLWANDDGEGGTFALYSLICRHAKERLETSLTMKKILLVLVLAGTAMVIANGVVTPAMSVLSSVGGLKVGVDAIEQDEVVMISVAFLVILFSVQKYGTSKVGLAVGPALLIWFCSLAGIGIYNLVKYDSSVLRAFNPIHIYYFFKRNSTKAWYSLGGCLLCATGSEAMFADLCYFSVQSVQLSFVFLVLPCLLLGYLGQAAYLMQNHAGADQVFFHSVPSGAFWPVLLIANIAALIASRAMTTATFSLVFVCTISNIDEIGNAYGIAELGVMMMTTILVTLVMLLIWQIHIIIVLSFAVVFLGIELTFFSSVLGSVADGSWIILVFSVIMFLIMYVWNYGSKLKYETEVKQKLSMDLMRELGCNLGTIRAPGIGLVYNELVKGIPGIFGHFLTTLPAIHSMIIFVSIKYVPVPVVPQSERFLFRRVCPKSYHIFRCIARYGYKDVRKENHQTFEQLLIESLEKFIRREAQERSLESDGDDDTDLEDERSGSRVLIAPNGSVYSLGVPLLADFQDTSTSITEASTSEVSQAPPATPSAADAEQSFERELSFIHKAKESGVVYLLGHGDIRARKDSWFFKKLVINYFYAFLRKNCRRGITTLSVPHSHLIQVGMTYMV
ncbi:hypothetical protein L6164_032583 [Bauhinia variegata]|uniref:Uncharacterized protein n=1 Tax=Bauhinia variegata TaxID=167791 RepID=A0ACB9KP37_BAUVA|nr:hypothetical protein L6164_032583 [Bauhinia variegata]